MLRAIKLASVGLCAAGALLMTPASAQAQAFTTWLFAEGSTSSRARVREGTPAGQPEPDAGHGHHPVFTQDGDAIRYDLNLRARAPRAAPA